MQQIECSLCKKLVFRELKELQGGFKPYYVDQGGRHWNGRFCPSCASERVTIRNRNKQREKRGEKTLQCLVCKEYRHRELDQTRTYQHFIDDQGKSWSGHRCPKCALTQQRDRQREYLDASTEKDTKAPKPKMTKRLCSLCSKPLPETRRFYHEACFTRYDVDISHPDLLYSTSWLNPTFPVKSARLISHRRDRSGE